MRASCFMIHFYHFRIHRKKEERSFHFIFKIQSFWDFIKNHLSIGSGMASER